MRFFRFFLSAFIFFCSIEVFSNSIVGETGNVKDFFKKIMTEKLDGYYIEDFSAIENITMKKLFNPSSASWLPALECVEFGDVEHSALLDSESDELSELLAEEEEVKADNGEVFLNMQDTLRLYGYDEEYLSVFDNTIESSNKDCVLRTEYDELMRVSKKIKWDISKSQQEPEITSLVRYEYSDDSIAFPRKTVEVAGEKEITRLFDEMNGLALSKVLAVDGKKKSENEWKYDDSLRLTLEKLVRYEEDKVEEYKKEYFYTSRSAEPDIKVYENGILRFSEEHTDENIYTTTTYFENNYAISAYFVHGRKEIETVYLNDKVVRRRRFN